MSNERPNEFLPWRGMLARPDALPEIGLDDKEQSWQRLSERLRKQPRRRGIAWWPAAACLILALFLSASRLFRARPTDHKSVAIQFSANHQSSTQQQPVTSVQQPVTLILPCPARPVTRTTRPVRPSNSNYGEIATIRPTGSFNTSDTVLTSALPVTPTTILATAPATILATTPPPRRPLRIAYLNEINNPGPSLLQAPRQPGFLRLGTATAAEYSVNNPAPIININISSPNH